MGFTLTLLLVLCRCTCAEGHRSVLWLFYKHSQDIVGFSQLFITSSDIRWEAQHQEGRVNVGLETKTRRAFVVQVSNRERMNRKRIQEIWKEKLYIYKYFG